MSYLKGFFILSIFCIGFIGITEGGLSYTVTGNKTSFSISNYCHPNVGTSSSRTSPQITYDQISIKIGNASLMTGMYTACYHLIQFVQGESKIRSDYGLNVPTPLYVQSNSNWDSATCIIKQLSPIIIASDGTISQNGNFELKCDIELKNGGPHTITIEDPLYDSTNAPSLGQITDINIGLTEPTRMMEGGANQLHYRNGGNAKSIENMNGLPQLKTLDLSNNKISSTQFLIKNNSINVRNLEKLDLSNNNISSIYENDLGSFSSLKELNLSSNGLTEINSNTFKDSQISNLEYLDLSKNRISNIGANSFYKFSSKLQELKLDGQKVDPLTISPYAFSGLNNLTSLHLENNKIETLVGSIFNGLTHIQNLNLENNKIKSIIKDTNGRDPFDKFATDSTGQILINLSGNQIKSTAMPDDEIWKALPDSLNSLVNSFKSKSGINLIFGSNNYLNKAPNYKLALDLTNNQINFIKITNTTISYNVNQTFNRFGYSYNHASPKYRREVKNKSGDIKQSGVITGINGDNSKSINLGESFSGTFHVYILSGSEKVAHDKIGVETQNNSTITISRETDNGFSIIENNDNIPFRIVTLKIEGHPSNVNVDNYTYEIEKGSQIYLSGDFYNSNNTFQQTFNFENGEYTITVIMYNEDGEITRKTLKFNINVPYTQNKLQITYPESSGLSSTGILDKISRTHDWNSKDCINDSFIDYGKYISGFLCELIDGNGTTHLSRFVKINPPKSNDFACRSTGYEVNNLNLNLPNGRYTLSVKILDISGFDVGSPKTLRFDKGKIYTVKFNTNGGTPIPEKEIGEGEILSKPEDPTKTGHIFLEWYTDSSLTNVYDFRVHVIQGFTLYAKWLEDNTIPPPELYSVTINYSYANGGYATGSKTEYYESGQNYSITSPTISGYTPSQAVINGTMGNSNQNFEVIYTKNETSGQNEGTTTTTTTSNSSDLSLKVSNKNPDIDERIKLTIYVKENYTGKVEFPKIQYHNGSKRTTISNTSSSYISDYSDELDEGYVQFRTSDYGTITISKFVKFSRSGKFKIYAEDKYGDSRSIQINVGDDYESSSSSTTTSSSKDSNLTLSANSTSLTTYEPINITIKTDSYVGKINLYAKYRDLTSSYRVKISNNSTEYLSDYSNIWENGFYKMTSSDKGKKTFSNLVEFKKPGTYRIYAEDANGFANFIQIYVNENHNITGSILGSSNTGSTSSENDEIERLLRELLNKKNGTNSGIISSTSTQSTSSQSPSIEQNKQNINSSSDEVYVSRSCKEYRIQYNGGLGVFTSPDLKKTEYFISKDYFKRYIDSKNPQKENCPKNSGWISTSYNDNSSNSDHYIAPNGKVYFITRENGVYKSNGLTKEKEFQSLNEIKYYIRDRNPLIGMTNTK